MNPTKESAFPHDDSPSHPENQSHGLTKLQLLAGLWAAGALADPALRLLPPAVLAERAKAFASALLSITDPQE